MQSEIRSCRCPKEHAEIWLSPPCDSESNDGRLWAPDNAFDPCPECGAQAVRFVRADLVAGGKPCDPADPCSTAHDLASERDTLDGLLFETKDRLDAALAQVERLRAALEWYGENARLARLIHSEGDKGRHAIAEDGGKRARAALAETADTPAPAPASDGWTPWVGGARPVAKEICVEVKYRDGETGRPYFAYSYKWKHRGDRFDIVAYRIVEARDG